ncbi:MAG: cysteine-rich VLP protein [Oscillospiraceae bacterium]
MAIRTSSCSPLDCPCYMLNKWWTGSLCRYFREAVLPTDPALESAITGDDTSLKQKICPVCGKSYLPTTSQAYCSDFCRTLQGGNPSGSASAGNG